MFLQNNQPTRTFPTNHSNQVNLRGCLGLGLVPRQFEFWKHDLFLEKAWNFDSSRKKVRLHWWSLECWVANSSLFWMCLFDIKGVSWILIYLYPSKIKELQIVLGEHGRFKLFLIPGQEGRWVFGMIFIMETHQKFGFWNKFFIKL